MEHWIVLRYSHLIIVSFAIRFASDIKNNKNNNFISDTWSKKQSKNAVAQKMVSHVTSQNRCLHTITLIGEKTFYSTPTVASYTHHNTGIQTSSHVVREKWRNLPSKLWDKKLTDKNKKSRRSFRCGCTLPRRGVKTVLIKAAKALRRNLFWDEQPNNFPKFWDNQLKFLNFKAAHRSFSCYVKTPLIGRPHWYNTSTTTSVGHGHIGAINKWGKTWCTEHLTKILLVFWQNCCSQHIKSVAT